MTGWFKSTYSSGDNPNCVEVRFADGVGVRDSKNATGPAFAFGSETWRMFLDSAKAARFDV